MADDKKDKNVKKEKIIGIDLGTSNSAASILIGGKAEMIPAAEGVSLGGKAFPSYIAFTKDGQRLVGEPARRQAVQNPDRTVRAIKRKMGTSHRVKIDNKEYSPEELSSMILQKIKLDAEAYLGEKIEKAVITVPAYFNDSQRTATKNAGKIAGLEVVRIINEPTAACLAYGLDKAGEKSLKIAVLDEGGGTFDVTLMSMGEGVFEVISTSGDTALGGTDMDKAVQDWIVAEFRKQTGQDLTKDHQAMMRVLEAAEKAKIELSSVFTTRINLPFITAGPEGPLHLDLELTRSKLEELVDPIVKRLIPPMERALKDSGLQRNQIDRIIMIGGPSRMPIVQKIYADFFGKKPLLTVDPMEAVAQGAAIQGAILSGEVKDLLLLDVTPLTLSVETLGGVATAIIERNTTIPVEKAKVFSTAVDNQPGVEIHVLQGERPMAKDNISLGIFHLDGIPPAPRGVPQVEVKFSIDANGILQVTAKDLGTNKSQSITISGASKLSEEEIKRKIDDARKFEEEDKKTRENIETRNKAESMSYQIEKMLKDYGDKLDESTRNVILKDIEDVRDALKKENNFDDIKAKSAKLEQDAQKLGEAVYKQQQAAGAANAAQQAAQGFQGAPGAGPQGEPDYSGFGNAGGATYDSGKKKDKKKVVDVDWEDEDKKK